MMKREQFEAALRERTQRQPFLPFTIELDGGDKFIVTERKAIHHFAGAATIYHPDGNFDFIDPEDVSRVCDMPLPVAS
jgi:hypothetical protein